MASKDEEQILVVPRAVLMPDDAIHGFRPGTTEVYVDRVRAHGVFRRRGDMEQDPSMKQIIPYLMVRHDRQLFVVQRSTAGGEARLHGKHSIGLGGHINRDDVEGDAGLLDAGLRRELEEELILRGPWRPRLVGVLNDDSNPVGSVHFGLVHVVDVGSPDIAVREADTLRGRLMNSDEVQSLYARMETWSQLILDRGDPIRL